MAKNYDFSFDPSKYEYHIHGNEVIAITHYHGRTVKAKAKCAPNDEFNLDKGKEIAAARCYLKVCSRRAQTAHERVLQAQSREEQADTALEVAKHYYHCARVEENEALKYVKKVEDQSTLYAEVEKFKQHLEEQCFLIGISPPFLVQEKDSAFQADWFDSKYGYAISLIKSADTYSLDIADLDTGEDTIEAKVEATTESGALQLIKIILKNYE